MPNLHRLKQTAVKTVTSGLRAGWWVLFKYSYSWISRRLSRCAGRAADSYRWMNSILSHPLLWYVLLCQPRSLQSEQRPVDPREPAAQRQQQVHYFLQVSCKHKQVNTSGSDELQENHTSLMKAVVDNEKLYRWTCCTCPSHWFSAVPVPRFRSRPPAPGAPSAPRSARPSPAAEPPHCSSGPHTSPPGRQEWKHTHTLCYSFCICV